MIPNNDSPFNDWADFWRYDCGLNVVPAESRNKRTYEKWSQWQDEPIREDQHEEWKRSRSFSNGTAIMCGKVWHKEELKDYYLSFIDLDNEKAIKEVCNNVFGVKDLKELSQITIVEQHLDNMSKAHVYFYTKHVLKKKSSDVTKLKDKIEGNEIPAIEVKGLGEHGIAICSPSVHKDGSKYEIVGKTRLGIFDGKEIEDKLFDIYRKYDLIVGDTKDGDINKIPMGELLRPGFIIGEGHNRHEAVLRVIEHYYLKYRESKSLDEIYDMSWKYNLNNCKPPLSQSDFERQLNDGIRFVDKTNANNQQVLLLRRQNQLEQQLKTDPQIIYKIADCKGNIVKAYYIDEKTGQICYGVIKEYGIDLEKCIIDIAPKRIRYYFNPLFPISEPKVELEYFDGKDVGKIGPYASLSELLKVLEIKGYVLNRNKSADAFSSVVSAMKDKENGLVEYLSDVTTLGYYLIDGKLVTKGISQNTEEIQKEEAIECCELLDNLATGWKNKEVFPTVLKWGLLAPFSFIIKSNSDKYMPWLQMYGQGQSGKTTLGLLVLQAWNRPSTLKKGFNNIDTPARFGETVSKDTYPVLVNEVGSLYETGKFRRYTNIIELIKHSVESPTARAKFVEQNNFQDIPALSPLMLTSNYAPPNDGGFNRRIISIHFPKDEKKEDDRRVLFDKLLEDKKKYLKTLGDFAAQYISKAPSILLKEDWKNIAKDILIEFYQFADKEVPEWIEYFVEQKDAVDESNENTMFALRSFLITRVNETYSRHKDKDNAANTISERLEFCLENELIPFFQKMKGDIIITHDILDEINNRNRIENITSLKDVGLQLGLEYKSRYINNKKMRVLCGPLDKLLKFINPDIVSEH